MINPKKQMDKAKRSELLSSPFFARFLLKCPLIEDTKQPTCYTDGKVIGYNPGFVQDISFSELQGVFRHEEYHLILGHCLMMKNKNHKIWNMATDYVINIMVISDGLKLPPGLLLDYRFSGLNSEQVYKILMQEQKEGKEPEPQNWGQIKPKKNASNQELTEPEQSKELNKLKREVKQAQNIEKKRNSGTEGGNVKRITDAFFTPQIDVKDLLRDFLTETIQAKWDYKKLNRRLVYTGLRYPKQSGKTIGKGVIFVDASGSISDFEFNIYSSEISNVLSEFEGIELTVIFFDTQVRENEIVQYSSYDLPLKLKSHAGGGTDIRAPFKYVELNELDPDFCLVFSDMGFSLFPSEPDYPVIFITDETGKGAVIPWGQLIDIKIFNL